MEKILLDTNFLVAPFQFSFPLFEEIDRLYPVNRLYTLEDAVQEAKSIENGKYGDPVEKLIEKKDIEVLETEKEEKGSSPEEGQDSVDDLIVRISGDYIIATNDKELKRRLLEENREVVIIRGKNHLEALNRNRL